MSDLIERVKAAMDAADDPLDYRTAIRAAIGVVLEDATDVCRTQFCEVHKPSYYDDEHEYHDEGVRACITALEGHAATLGGGV